MRAAIVALLLLIPNGELWAQFDCQDVPTFPGEDITLEVVATGLSSPVDLQAAPGDENRIFVVERSGRIRIIDITDDSVGPEFLDIHTRVNSGGELGLLGLAFHPNYEENGFFYVNYTRDGSSNSNFCGAQYKITVISRFHAPLADNADEGSEQVLLTYDQPFGNHNAGQIAFHPDNEFLYISMGDGGSGGDPCNSGQDPDSLLGKMLRIDVDAGGEAPYGIPSTNPYVDDPSILDEIWAFGLRNPWRFSFDAGTPTAERRGDLYIADVGQGSWEEVDYVEGDTGGYNFGWDRWEGEHNHPSPATVDDHTEPVHEYRHGGGRLVGFSITGGVVYRGCRMPDLRGAYFFADYVNDWVATLRVSDTGVASQPDDVTNALNAGIPGSMNGISSFGTDNQGEVYVVELGGRISRVVSSNPPLIDFRRGDANASGLVLIDDVIVTLQCLFLGITCPTCFDAADADDNGVVDIVDPLRIAFYLFGLAETPPAPGPTDCGKEESFFDNVGCETYAPCP